MMQGRCNKCGKWFDSLFYDLCKSCRGEEHKSIPIEVKNLQVGTCSKCGVWTEDIFDGMCFTCWNRKRVEENKQKWKKEVMEDWKRDARAWEERTCELASRCQSLQEEVNRLRVIMNSYASVGLECTKESYYQHLKQQNRALRKKLYGMRKQFKQYSAYIGGLVAKKYGKLD